MTPSRPSAAVLALIAALWGLFSPAPAAAQLANGVCIPSTIPYTSPTWFPACDATGHLLVADSGTVTASFPYAGTNGQALTAASFVGVGARDANGQFSPLQEDVSQNLLAKIVSGSTTAVTQATAANLNATVTLQTGSANAGGVELFDSAGTNKASINLPGAQLVAQGKTRFILTSGSPTVCTNLQATAGNLVELVNVGSATAVFPAWYDDAGATCATGARVYGNFTSLTLQAGQAISLNIPLNSGLAYKLSGALSDNLVVVTQ